MTTSDDRLTRIGEMAHGTVRHEDVCWLIDEVERLRPVTTATRETITLRRRGQRGKPGHESFSDGEKTSHFEEYDSADWTRHPSSAASAIYGCVKGVFGHEDDVRRVFDELEKFTVSKEDE